MTIDQALDVAMQHHGAGRLGEAEAIYRQILSANPNHPDALHLLGLVAYQVGQYVAALKLIDRAITISSGMAAYHSNRGQVLAAAGRVDDAITSYHRALAIEPGYADALNGLGATLQTSGRLEESVAIYARAIAANPQSVVAHNNLGVALTHLNRFDDAIRSLRQAIALQSDYADAHLNLGNALRLNSQLIEAIAAFRTAVGCNPNLATAHNNLGAALRESSELSESMASLRQALAIEPGYAEAHNNLGMSLLDDGRPEEAIAEYQAALSIRPNYPEALNNLGEVLQRQGRLEEAISQYEKAKSIQPDYAAVYNNLGGIHQEMKQLDEAMSQYQHALSLAPNDPIVHYNIGTLKLLRGDLVGGFREVEWQRRMLRKLQFKQPEWKGEELHGRRILLFAEQGFGDTIQFVRYVAQVQSRGGDVILACQPELVRLLQSILPKIEITPQGQIPSDFDVQCPLLSLPMVMGTTLETIPAAVPYLHSEPELSARWRERLAGPRLKVGLVWAGQPKYRNDRNRSISLSTLAPLFAMDGIDFVSLQKGSAATQVRDSKLLDWTSELYDWADTAALIDNLDLIVSVDTAVAHLAGAMSKPVWVILPMVPEWRWMIDRTDSPWYPTMRLFCQPRLGDWNGAVSNVAEALTQFRTASKT